MDITNRDPREASLIQMKRYQSGDLESAGRHMRHRLESSRIARGILKAMGVLAVTNGHVRWSAGMSNVWLHLSTC